MNYGDFSSLVQLGVGLHIGTALFQLYGEIGMAPLVRKFSRIKTLMTDEDVPDGNLREDFANLESDFEIFKIEFFFEYRKYIAINAVVAVLLVIALIFISYKAGDRISDSVSVLFVALSTITAPTTLAVLWCDANRAIGPLKKKADELQEKALRGSNQKS